MFRYVALVWNTRDLDQADAVQVVTRRLQASHSEWGDVFNHAGLRVFCADSLKGSIGSHALSHRAGVILGTLFERNKDPEDSTASLAADLNEATTSAIVASKGRHLLTHFWGDYIALIADVNSTSKWVIKDPTGDLPGSITFYRGVMVIFSCLADCLDLELMRFTVNPLYVRSRLISIGMDRTQSSLNEVSQIGRGEFLEIDPSANKPLVSRESYWNPLWFSESENAIEDPVSAARAVRATVRACVHTLAACHKSLLLRLSGGLDSSIILGCLSDAPCAPEIVGYTYYNPRGLSDERRWARLAAQQFGIVHIEHPTDPASLRLDPMLSMSPSIEPLSGLAYLERGPVERAIAQQHNCTAVFSGDGGDSSFGSECVGLVVEDYLRRHGFRADVLKLAVQVAMTRDLTIWTVIGKAMRGWLLGARMSDHRDSYLEGCRLLSQGLRETVLRHDRYPHPWFSDSNGVPWRTIYCLGMLTLAPQFYDPFCEAHRPNPLAIAPLYSQPVIELCLRIPLHIHFNGGRSRGLARQAFTQEVPEAILQRQWKDRAPGYAEDLMSPNLALIRSILLDGVLTRDGLLDRAAVERVLSGKVSKNDVAIGEIFNYIDLELWQRHFSTNTRHREAA